MRTAALLAATLLAAAAAHAEDARTYELMIDSTLRVKTTDPDHPQERRTVTRLRYSLEPRDDGDALSLLAVQAQVVHEDKTRSLSLLSRDQARFVLGEQPAIRYTNRTAPAKLRAVMNLFEQPVALVHPDSDGSAPALDVQVPADSILARNGLIEATRLFHGRFPADADTWEAPLAIPAGSGEFTVGNASYRKAGAGPGGTVRVSVQGELKDDRRLGDGSIRGRRYTVRGEQLYDAAARSWTAGVLTVELTQTLLDQSAAPAGTVSGTLTFRMKTLAFEDQTLPESNPEDGAIDKP
jgi:hypothetical protein